MFPPTICCQIRSFSFPHVQGNRLRKCSVHSHICPCLVIAIQSQVVQLCDLVALWLVLLKQ